MPNRSILDLAPPPPDIRLPYGSDPLQYGDLRLPPGPGPHPVGIVIHGGFWRARYSLEHIGHLCAALTAAGFATWNLEYRRLGDPGGGWPHTLLDVARGADYLREVSAQYPLDLNRLLAVGHSAGGHLALWLAARHRLAADNELYLDHPLPLRGVISLAGVSDLISAWLLRLGNGVVGELLGGTPDTAPARYAAASPAELLPMGVSQALIHGTEDSNVPFSMSQAHAARARATGDHAALIPLPGMGHFEPIDPRSGAWPMVLEGVRQLLPSSL
ncbi:MAG: alpha/beta hydrolase [Chloroflexota bacterium]|nr:alpha/beta hydrolase [Chloroflexota bacterium]